jgi:hypothetical protein
MSKFNNWLALVISNSVGTMYCAYTFAVMGGAGVYFALTNNTKGVLIIGSISGYFLQLVLLPIIMVAQNLQSKQHNETIKAVRKIHKHLKI